MNFRFDGEKNGENNRREYLQFYFSRSIRPHKNRSSRAVSSQTLRRVDTLSGPVSPLRPIWAYPFGPNGKRGCYSQGSCFLSLTSVRYRGLSVSRYGRLPWPTQAAFPVSEGNGQRKREGIEAAFQFAKVKLIYIHSDPAVARFRQAKYLRSTSSTAPDGRPRLRPHRPARRPLYLSRIECSACR